MFLIFQFFFNNLNYIVILYLKFFNFFYTFGDLKRRFFYKKWTKVDK
jgi:hypothetical protein